MLFEKCVIIRVVYNMEESLMSEKMTELSVSTEVLEKMAELAAKEVDGVIGLSKKTVDLRDAVKTGNALKGVKVENINGAIAINVYLCVKNDAQVRQVAEAVQRNIKDKIQTMTGTAVTKVNVTVADIDFENAAEEQATE